MFISNKFEEKKNEVDEEIEKNLLLKKILLLQEKRIRTAKFSQLGRIAHKAELDQMDEEALLGAFLEIAAYKQNPECLERWKKESQTFLDEQSKKSDQDFSAFFLEHIS